MGQNEDLGFIDDERTPVCSCGCEKDDCDMSTCKSCGREICECCSYDIYYCSDCG